MHDQQEPIFGDVVGHDGALAITRAALKEGDVHICYVGPPGCGKTVILMAIEERVPGAVYRDGRSLSPSKLRERLKDDPSVLCIDEIDALSRDAYDELALPLESGRVQKDTTIESYDVEVGTQVIAACNHIEDLPDNIRSRFRKVMLTEYSKQDYIRVCGNICYSSVEWVESRSQGEKIGKVVMKETGETDPRDARDVARLAGSMDKVPEIARAFQEPGAKIDSDPITPSDVARAKPHIGRERLTEMAIQEQRLSEVAEHGSYESTTDVPSELEQEAHRELQRASEMDHDVSEEERDRIEREMKRSLEERNI